MDDMNWRWWSWVHWLGNIKVGWILFVGRWKELGHVVVVVDDTRRSNCAAVAVICMMKMNCWKFCGGELNSWIRW